MRRSRGGRLVPLAAHELLGLAHREFALEHDAQRGALQLGDGDRRQRAPVALADAALDDGLACLRGEVEQAQGVADGDPALADLAGDRLVGQTESIDQLAVGEAVSIGLRSSRWRFSMSASSSESVPASVSRMTAGITSSPARRAARRRRSPAISS